MCFGPGVPDYPESEGPPAGPLVQGLMRPDEPQPGPSLMEILDAAATGEAYRRQQMTHLPRPERPTMMEALDAAALGAAPIPVAGDLAGLGVDAYRYATQPESRNWMNYGLSAVGALPFVPPLGTVRRVGGWFGRLQPDDLPLTGADRGALLGTPTAKTKPGKIVEAAISQGRLPETAREEAVAFLAERKARAAERKSFVDQGYDGLSLRKPGHALAESRARKHFARQREFKDEAALRVQRQVDELRQIPGRDKWSKTFAAEVEENIGYAEWAGVGGAKSAINRANMEAVPRLLKKEGWTVRHGSKGTGGRKSSRYIVSPDGKYEVRLSDHNLPDTPQREHSQRQYGTRWDADNVLDGTDGPEDVVTAVRRLFEGPAGELE